ncbi:MAG: nucleoside deaminase [Candidatus Omnitrophica bacterium]|nr:nucleoside deaminase [Candidatus Omnitrophota bacterium]
MLLAIKKAEVGIARGQTPFGACIVKNGKVISCEHNIVWSASDITAHAEITAIRQGCIKLKTIDLSGSVIYSTCEPCPMCFSACHWAKISRIVYGASIADAENHGFNELNISNKQLKQAGKSEIKLVGGVLKQKNIDLFKKWSALSDRRVY